MSGRELLSEIEADLQKARFVVYLEGKTDPDMFFALLGIHRPAGDIHQDVYVRGLSGRGSGGSAVSARVRVAASHGYGLVPQAGGVLGVIDGDGRELPRLAAEFDAPHDGPWFSWKGYCLENLLARAAWPTGWGTCPDWKGVLSEYRPYAAPNRVHVELRTALETLGLAKFTHPQQGHPLLTNREIKAALDKDRHLIAGRDVGATFDTESKKVGGFIAASVEAGHAMVNGKWLVRHYAPKATGKPEDRCRSEWCEAVRAGDGLPEVLDFWERFTGAVP